MQHEKTIRLNLQSIFEKVIPELKGEKDYEEIIVG